MKISKLVHRISDSAVQAMSEVEEAVNDCLKHGYEFATGTGYVITQLPNDSCSPITKYLVFATLVRDRTASDDEKPIRVADIF